MGKDMVMFLFGGCDSTLLLDVLRIGGPEGVRTLGHLVKSQVLYLAELQAQAWAAVPVILFIYHTLSSNLCRNGLPLIPLLIYISLHNNR